MSIDVTRLTRYFVSHECEIMPSAMSTDMSLLRSISELEMIKYDLENVKSSKQRTNAVNGNMSHSDSIPCFDLRLCLDDTVQTTLGFCNA